VTPRKPLEGTLRPVRRRNLAERRRIRRFAPPLRARQCPQRRRSGA